MAKTLPRHQARSRANVSPSAHGKETEESKLIFHDEVVHGLKPNRVKQFIDRGLLVAKQVYRVIPARTFSRRLAKGEPLKVSEGDAIARLLRINEAASKSFGDAEFARKWLNLPNPALKDRIPIEMAETDAGAREVETILSRIAHGDYT